MGGGKLEIVSASYLGHSQHLSPEKFCAWIFVQLGYFRENWNYFSSIGEQRIYSYEGSSSVPSSSSVRRQDTFVPFPPNF